MRTGPLLIAFSAQCLEDYMEPTTTLQMCVGQIHLLVSMQDCLKCPSGKFNVLCLIYPAAFLHLWT